MTSLHPVAPTSLNIIRGADSSVVQGTEGHNLYLQCLVNGARPAPSIAWYRNGLMLDDSLHTERADHISPETKRWSVRVVSWWCQVSKTTVNSTPVAPSIPRSPGPTRRWWIRSPSRSYVSTTAPSVSGGTRKRQWDCVWILPHSEGGRTPVPILPIHGREPTPQLSWYRDGRLLQQHPNITHSSKAASEDGGEAEATLRWAVTGETTAPVTNAEPRTKSRADSCLRMTSRLAFSVSI
ncbi:uncharacterized protein LOC135209812 [Macrobrachium nipponense]|uniref:uncharacterized protein LOC135209812 n=1 Tax=Macrobrachium nipponense TaxID=159736 RepID=UPI0030C8BA59